MDEKELNEKKLLLRDPDYDIYVRRFQCEQSPPSPLQFALHDPIEGSFHKPVFRPEIEDTNRPLSDEYLPDLRPFETIRPGIRPPYRPPYQNYVDRPDISFDQEQNFDQPPTYGLHKPQDIPFRPERPQNINRPYQNYSTSHDVLHFQDGRPRPPTNWRPDPQYPLLPADDISDLYGQRPTRPRPELPPFTSEDSQYVYINRPNRKPSRPNNDFGYGTPPKPVQNYPIKPDPYGPSDPIRPEDPPNPYKPSRPMDYLPRPQNRPTYDYHGQYASNYGQNQYHDNSIYLEIYDPPRPYRPRPMHDRPVYGNDGQNYVYGQQGDNYGGSYTSQNHQSSYGTVTQIYDYNRPVHRPPKPVYENPTSGYGPQNTYRPSKPSIDSPSVIYGGLVDPIKKPDKPIPDGSDIGYGYQKPQKPVYESPSSDSGYGSLQDIKPQKPFDQGSSYGGTLSSSQHFDSGYGVSHKPQDIYRPSYNPGIGSHLGYGTQSDFNNQGYGLQSQGIYSTTNQYGGSSQEYVENYGNKPLSDNRPLYTGNKPSINDEIPSYGSIILPYDDHPSYGNNKPSFNDDRPSYGNNKPSYNDVNLSYGNNKPLFNDDRPSYGNNKPSFNDDRPSYGGNSPSHDDVPSYGNKPIDNHRPYGNKPSFTANRPSYGSTIDNDRPLHNKPSNDVPSYNRPPYNKPTNDASSYNKPSNDAPSYNRPLNDSPSYNKPKPPSYNKPPLDNDRPDDPSSYGTENEDIGYKNNRKTNKTATSNGQSIKPVYENDVDKPNAPSYIIAPGGEVITSRPVSVGNFGNGREPGLVNYKGKFHFLLF